LRGRFHFNEANMPLDVIPPPNASGGSVKLGDMALQAPDHVDIRGGRAVRMLEVSSENVDVQTLTAQVVVVGVSLAFANPTRQSASAIVEAMSVSNELRWAFPSSSKITFGVQEAVNGVFAEKVRIDATGLGINGAVGAPLAVFSPTLTVFTFESSASASQVLGVMKNGTHSLQIGLESAAYAGIRMTDALAFSCGGSDTMIMGEVGNGVRIMNALEVGTKLGVGITPTFKLHVAEAVAAGTSYFAHANTAAAATTNHVSWTARANSSVQERSIAALDFSFNATTDASRNGLVKLSNCVAGSFSDVVTIDGANVGIGNAPSGTALLELLAGTTARSSLRIPHGAAPTSPVNGDMWTTTAGVYFRINGATVGPLT
jgi:hypothetical protein